jgi:hypothetical protein
MGLTTSAFIKSLKHPLKFRMFLLSNLPQRIFLQDYEYKDIDETVCRVSGSL